MTLAAAAAFAAYRAEIARVRAGGRATENEPFPNQPKPKFSNAIALADAGGAS